MSTDPGPTAEMRAHINLTKREIVHLWSGGILSLKVEGPAMEADLELHCSEVESERGIRILVKRVSAA